MSLTVDVERKHIDNAVPKSTTECPIARALNEQYPLGRTWCVWLNWAALWPGRGYTLPKKAIQWQLALLEGQSAEPFTFTLEE